MEIGSKHALGKILRYNVLQSEFPSVEGSMGRSAPPFSKGVGFWVQGEDGRSVWVQI